MLNDEICNKLCEVAYEKSKELNIDITFAICDEKGILKYFQRFGDVSLLSVSLVPAKAYTSAIMKCETKILPKLIGNDGPLNGIQSIDPKITSVSGGFPLFENGKLVGGIGIGGGVGNQDCIIGEAVIEEFNKLIMD